MTNLMTVVLETGREQSKVEIKLETTNGSNTLIMLRTHTPQEDIYKLSQLKRTMGTINIPLVSQYHVKTTAHMAFSLSKPKCLKVKVHGLHFGFYLEKLIQNMEDGQHAEKLISIKVSRVQSKSMGLSTSEPQNIIIPLHQITTQESTISRTGILTQLIGILIKFVGMLMLRL